MRFLFFIFVLGISYSAISQTCCSDKCIKKLEKNFRKTKRLVQVEISFQLANCYKGKSDTLSKFYFFRSIEIAKSTTTCGYQAGTARLLYINGLSYFELKDYKTSEIYLSKAIASKYQDSVTYYYYGLTQLNANKYKEALINFEKQKELYPKVNEVMVGNYIQTCKASITK